MLLSNPLLFLVSGAWHQPAHFELLAAQLARHDLQLHVPLYKSIIFNFDQPFNVSAQDDTDTIREQLMAQLNAQPERDVVVLAHSYGGIPAGGAAHGLSKTQRLREGKKNGVVGLIWLTAFPIFEGESLFVNRAFANASKADKGNSSASLSVNQPKPGLSYWPNPIPIFYHDCDPAVAQAMSALLKYQAISAFATPAAAPAWKEDAFDGRRAFVRHLLDRAIPIGGQDRLIEFTEEDWITRDIDASHSAFASKPGELAGIVKELVGEFGKEEVKA